MVLFGHFSAISRKRKIEMFFELMKPTETYKAICVYFFLRELHFLRGE